MTDTQTTHDVIVSADRLGVGKHRVSCSSCGDLGDFPDYGAATNVARWHRRQNTPGPVGDPFAGFPGSGVPFGATGHTKQGAPMDTTTDEKADAAAPVEPSEKQKRVRPSRSKAAKAERAAAAGKATNVVDIKRANGAKKQTAKQRRAAASAPANPVDAKAPPASKGPKFRLFHDGKPQTDVQNKLSSIAYDFTKDVVDGQPRIGVADFRKLLAEAGVADPDGTAWKVTLTNGHVIESKAI